MKNLRIAHSVESYYPSVGGMQEVVKRISEYLVKMGHDVTVFTSKNDGRHENIINGVKIKQFNLSGNSVKGIRGDKEEYIRDILSNDFQIITLFAAQQWATDIILENLDRFKGKKIVFVPTGFSAFYLPAYSEYFREMSRWIKRTDANVFLSENYRDINFARLKRAKNITIIPNGADENEFISAENKDIRQQLGLSKHTRILLTVGSHTGLKGHRELLRVFARLKTPDTALIIQGNDTTLCKVECLLRSKLLGLTGRKVFITDFSRKETVSAFKNADLFVFTSNIECSPIVLFEAAAAGLPVVTADVGNSREIIKWLKNGKILPTIITKAGYSYIDVNKSAIYIDKLLLRTDKLKYMSETGFKNWHYKYTWGKIAQMYEHLYRKVLS